jgi:arabinose-5-phosphate isomerase
MLRPRSALLEIPLELQLACAKDVLLAESAALHLAAQRLDGSFADAAALLANAEGCVLVTGMGKAGLIGQKVAATLASTGTRAHFLHPAEACHGDLGRIGPDDVVLAFSHSGQTPELTQILPSIQELGVPIVAVTSRDSSDLAKASDAAIVYGPIDEACPIGMAPSATCAVMLGIGDALAFVLMRMRDFGASDFHRRHPSGSLGRRLQRVERVMRTGAQMRIASADLSVREAFVSVHRPGRRTGAICLVDERGRLVGLFTDSDLAKLLERADVEALRRPIRECMTPNPITAEPGQLVQDVLELFKRRQVSEIPVVDAEGAPIGVVDITDLVDLLPEAA